MNKKLLTAICVFSISSALASNPPHCYPKPSATEQNHMIGYGSLMEKDSRLHTNPKAEYAYPIEVNGFKRSWGVHEPYHKITFLTIVAAKDSSLNAVYYNIKSQTMLSDDIRERGYCRVRVPNKDIKALALNTLDPGAYWIYVQKTPRLQTPNTQFPIVQSYVDIFLNGCMQVAHTYRLNQFTEKCITETTDWPSVNTAWINDRVHPKRPFDIPNAFKIDMLLAEHFKNYYNHPYE